MPTEGTARPTRGRRFLFVVLTLAGLALLTEIAARLVVGMTRVARPRPNALDAYEVLDASDPRLWRLRPGFSQTMDELIRSKEREGKRLAVRHYTAAMKRLDIPGDRTVLRVNQDGFRGPELADPPRGMRLLILGDSCTFGTIEEYTYPRVLDRELPAVEVVNGGVEGYAPQQLLWRIDEYRRLGPDVTLIYIGWNALFAERLADAPEDSRAIPRDEAAPRLQAPRLLRRAVRALWPRQTALEAYEKTKRPARDDPQLARLESWEPSFMGQLRAIVDGLAASGSEVLLLTLPGLYASDEEPSRHALEIGHLPVFTDNPYVLARMAERYNAALRELAREHGLRLIDLETWSRRELRPRDRFFIDSVHLVEEGQALLGLYLAEQLRPYLATRSRRGGTDRVGAGGAAPGRSLMRNRE